MAYAKNSKDDRRVEARNSRYSERTGGYADEATRNSRNSRVDWKAVGTTAAKVGAGAAIAAVGGGTAYAVGRRKGRNAAKNEMAVAVERNTRNSRRQ